MKAWSSPSVPSVGSRVHLFLELERGGFIANRRLTQYPQGARTCVKPVPRARPSDPFQKKGEA